MSFHSPRTLLHSTTLHYLVAIVVVVVVVVVIIVVVETKFAVKRRTEHNYNHCSSTLSPSARPLFTLICGRIFAMVAATTPALSSSSPPVPVLPHRQLPSELC
ncbi:hypothetical protein TYRP_020108 [Tyrophagus putrescentiae]|nr:hypothetical protein TYRP_020108 [Tyrophagus putrescentiae]